MEQKQVKIVGFSINSDFGALKATKLTFDDKNRLTVIKGEVGSGKTTLNKGMRLVTQGTGVLEDKNLYGDSIDLEVKLMDGELPVYIGCKSKKDGTGIDYVLYTVDANGKKLKEVVIDGKKATPSNYLKSLQTALTWRLNELTSENPTVQRNILLELYRNEIESKGVIFDKSHPDYVGGIIDQIEKAKNKRDIADSKRKEVGGIADDLSKKGIDYNEAMPVKDLQEFTDEIATITAKITLAKQSVEQTRTSTISTLKMAGMEAANKIRDKNSQFQEHNRKVQKLLEQHASDVREINDSLQWAKDHLQNIKFQDEFFVQNLFEKTISAQIVFPEKPKEILIPEVKYNDKNNCISEPAEYQDIDKDMVELIKNYQEAVLKYVNFLNLPVGTIDTAELEAELTKAELKLKTAKEHNESAIAVNSFLYWQQCNNEVKKIKKDYFMKLTQINTGVQGLYICPEYIVGADGERIAKDNDIYLMYDGSYDSEYFHNPKGELRKLAAYSDTQKPMICLLIQRYLLSKKAKTLPYLWIDQVPIDRKTKELLDRMSEEMGLWLFVNWTGDFEKENLKDGEILVEGGEIFFNEQ